MSPWNAAFKRRRRCKTITTSFSFNTTTPGNCAHLADAKLKSQAVTWRTISRQEALMTGTKITQ